MGDAIVIKDKLKKLWDRKGVPLALAGLVGTGGIGTVAMFHGHPFESSGDKTLRLSVSLLSGSMDTAADLLQLYEANWSAQALGDKAGACENLGTHFEFAVAALPFVYQQFQSQDAGEMAKLLQSFRRDRFVMPKGEKLAADIDALCALYSSDSQTAREQDSGVSVKFVPPTVSI